MKALFICHSLYLGVKLVDNCSCSFTSTSLS